MRSRVLMMSLMVLFVLASAIQANAHPGRHHRGNGWRQPRAGVRVVIAPPIPRVVVRPPVVVMGPNYGYHSGYYNRGGGYYSRNRGCDRPNWNRRY